MFLPERKRFIYSEIMNKNLSRTIGDRIRRLRKQKGLTQQELAEKVGMEYTMIGRVEQGVRNLTIEGILKVAEALDADVNYILAQKKKKTPLTEKDKLLDEITNEVELLNIPQLKMLNHLLTAVKEGMKE